MKIASTLSKGAHGIKSFNFSTAWRVTRFADKSASRTRNVTGEATTVGRSA